jgi:hypothetical protein
MDNKSQLPNNNTNTPNNDIKQSDKDTPTRIEVKNMLLEAKLDIAQKKITILLALFALLGVIYPFISSSKQEARIDREIDSMEIRFKELAGKQMRKPLLACFVDGKNLENSTLTFTCSGERKIIVIKNVGDGTADYFDYNVYVKMPQDIPSNPSWVLGSDWEQMELNDETFFDFKMAQRLSGGLKLPAGDVFHMKLQPYFRPQEKFDVQVQALLKIFYGDAEPKRIPFVMRLVSQGAGEK